MKEPADGSDVAKACLHPLKSLHAIIEVGLDHSFMAVECGACGRIIPKAVFQRIAARKRGRKGPRL
jgi:hypothetical protein